MLFILLIFKQNTDFAELFAVDTEESRNADFGGKMPRAVSRVFLFDCIKILLNHNI